MDQLPSPMGVRVALAVRQGLTASILEERLQEQCPQMLIDNQRPAPPEKEPALHKKPTRAQTIKELLAQQTAQPPGKEDHLFAETTGYLKCNKCGLNIRKRTNEAAFTDFVQSKCVDQAYTAGHTGRPTHALWQKGDKVTCTLCGIQWHLDSQKRVIGASAFRKECRGAGLKGSPPLSDYFKKRPSQTDKATNERPALNQMAGTLDPRHRVGRTCRHSGRPPATRVKRQLRNTPIAKQQCKPHGHAATVHTTSPEQRRADSGRRSASAEDDPEPKEDPPEEDVMLVDCF